MRKLDKVLNLVATLKSEKLRNICSMSLTQGEITSVRFTLYGAALFIQKDDQDHEVVKKLLTLLN